MICHTARGVFDNGSHCRRRVVLRITLKQKVSAAARVDLDYIAVVESGVAVSKTAGGGLVPHL